jgi:hypothetical protein
MSAFRDYVTSGAFQLSISRRQIDMLCQLDQYGASYGFLSTCGALIGKGLVERIQDDESGFPRVRLTEAGKAVIPLLKLCGLYMELPPLPEPVDLPEISITVKKREPEVEA